MAFNLFAHERVVTFQQRSPSAVAHRCGTTFGRPDDVGEQHRREDTVADDRSPSTREEMLDLMAPQVMIACYHDTMAKNLTVRLDEQLAADTEALARAEGKSLNETVKQALRESVERRRSDPEFKARLRRIINEDRELLERLAK